MSDSLVNLLTISGVVLWVILAFGDADDRNTFLDRTFKLVTDPFDIPGYSHKWVEDMETRLRAALTTLPKSWLDWLTATIKSLWESRQWKLLGQFVMLLLLPIFFLADAIVITNIVELLGLRVPFLATLPKPIPDLLREYSIAITVGTFFTVIAAGFVYFEFRSATRPLSDFRDHGEDAKRFANWLLLSSLVVGIGLGLAAFALAIKLPPWLDIPVRIFNQFSIHVLVRANVLLTTLLIFREALQGVTAIVEGVLALLVLVVGMIYFVVGILASLGRLLVDWVGRLFRWILWLLSFLVFAPLDKLVSAPETIVKTIGKAISFIIDQIKETKKR